MRIAAIDWSGRAQAAERHIWIATVCGGQLRLEGGRTREQVADHLVDLALAEPGLVAGLDFCFSLPVWFLDRVGLECGLEVPQELSERWLRECPPPFWGRPGRRRGPEPQHRRTEEALLQLGHARPRPVFQIGGAGAVGTASLRGFAVLARLRKEGFSVWPFDPPRLPLLVEIYPRLLTGPVRKSRPDQRRAHLETCGWPLEGAASEDAFDAEVSALVMYCCREQLARLPVETDPVLRREGLIWLPCSPPWAITARSVHSRGAPSVPST